MKDNLNVWTWSYPVKFYLKKPWRWFRELKWNIQNAWQRTTKGYCYIDWANFDMWFKEIAPKMLRDMAMHGRGYPGTHPFEDPENWNSWLHRMADQITTCQDENEGNEYYELYMNCLMKEPQTILAKEETDEEKELREKYYKRWLELTDEHKELFKKTMYEMLEHWDCLWD